MSELSISETSIIVAICILLGLLMLGMVDNNRMYSEAVGKTFKWNGNDIMVTSIGEEGKYVIVILPSNPNQSPVSVTADRKPVFEAYKASLPAETQLEKERK